MRRIVVLILILTASVCNSAFADRLAVTGLWQTIDDKTGQPKSVVELFERDNALFGRVVKIFPRAGKSDNPVCKKCPGDLKNQPVLGMEVVQGLQKEGAVWSNGKILDPENGKRYTCKLWQEHGRLQVRGYLMMFYRTQEWLRYAE